MSASHEQFRRQLQAYAAGLLDETRTLALEAHVAECGECKAALDTLRPLSPVASGHLPASLIANWSRVSLGEAERALVTSHLEHCEQCRATLRFAGHEPVLARAAAPAAARKPVLASRRAWGFAAWLVAGAAAAWFLVARVPVDPSNHMGSATIGAASESALQLEVVAPDAAALAWPAGGDATPLALSSAALGSGVVLALPDDMRTLAGGEVTLSLVGPSGTVVALRQLPRDSTGLRPAALRLHREGQLAAGRYVLRIAATPDSGAPFTLERSLAVE